MVTIETSVEELIERYKKEILFDCHQLETRISRSEAKACLRLKGKECLNFIGKEIKELQIDGGSNYDLLIAYVTLIYDIIDDHKLPPPPYGSGVKFAKQNSKVWIEYCEKNG